ncbi:MAG TPA: NADH-quinone oxidoreductase subunit C [Pyrinomonadaceae bacterium]|nr:NADH-quinone oxidoreductase subunit C [Pyrinomonadaceae bacterium]
MSQDIEREKEIAQAASASPKSYPAPSAESIEALRAEHAGWITKVVTAFGEVTCVVARAEIAEVCAHLKRAEGFEFNMLADLCGVDRGPEEEPRFEVNYHLFSTTRHHRLRLKVLLNEEDARVATVTGVWRTANWHERETFDMFGVVFEGHPDLRRILLPDDWQGHALRKDFPLRGFEPYSLT